MLNDKPGQEWPNDWRDERWKIARIEARTKAAIALILAIFFVAFPASAAIYGALSNGWALFDHVWLPSIVGLGWLAKHYFDLHNNSRGGGPPIERF